MCSVVIDSAFTDVHVLIGAAEFTDIFFTGVTVFTGVTLFTTFSNV